MHIGARVYICICTRVNSKHINKCALTYHLLMHLLIAYLLTYHLFTYLSLIYFLIHLSVTYLSLITYLSHNLLITYHLLKLARATRFPLSFAPAPSPAGASGGGVPRGRHFDQHLALLVLGGISRTRVGRTALGGESPVPRVKETKVKETNDSFLFSSFFKRKVGREKMGLGMRGEGGGREDARRAF